MSRNVILNFGSTQNGTSWKLSLTKYIIEELGTDSKYSHEYKRKYLVVEAFSDYGECVGHLGNGGGQRAEKCHSCIQSASVDLDFHLIRNVEALQTSSLRLLNFFQLSLLETMVSTCLS